MARSNAWARVGFGAFEPRASTRIEPRQGRSGEELVFGRDLIAYRGLEAGAARSRFAPLGRTTFGNPFLETPVEDRDIFCTEVAQHEPATSGGVDGRIVINDDGVSAANADPLHCSGEFLGAWQHVRRKVRMIAKLVDVEEARAGDVRC